MLDIDLSSLELLSHGVGILAFGVLAALLALGRGSSRSRAALVVVALVGVVWNAAAALTVGNIGSAARVEYALPARTLVIAGAVIALVWLEGAHQQARALGIALAILAVLWLAIYVDVLRSGSPSAWMFFIQVVTPMLGLMALENWFRNTAENQRWATKFAVVGLGLMFAYDLVTYLAASITGAIDPQMLAARGLVDAIAVPLIVVTAARRHDWTTGLHVSRQAAFYSASVVVCGGIFLLAAAGGYYVRNIGGTLGSFVQIVGSALIAVGVVVALASGTARSRVKRLIERNFFSYKYDYRVEWTRFIATIGAQESYLPLAARVVRAIADVLDCPGGVLWLPSTDGRAYTPAASWHVYGRTSPLSSGTPFIEAIGRVQGVAPLDARLSSSFDANEREVLGPFWAAVPVRHATISGFVTLLRPRARRNLTWEDTELLQIVGQQAAGYLAEEAAGRALLEAQQLEEFSQRFTFVAHDLKNLISQLQLLLRNAGRHSDNPEFQQDLLATVANSVEKMKKLLEQLRPQRRPIDGGQTPLDLTEVAGEIERRWAPAGVRFDRTDRTVPLVVRANHDRLHAALDHLVQNAVDAVGSEGHVTLSVFGRGEEGCIVVADDGPGMDDRFVREELFRPFRSTKGAGYGIGAYQAKELVKSMDGSLDVTTAPGKGTVVTVSLRCTASAPAVLPSLER